MSLNLITQIFDGYYIVIMYIGRVDIHFFLTRKLQSLSKAIWFIITIIL